MNVSGSYSCPYVALPVQLRDDAPHGDWCIDFHQRFDLKDAARVATDRPARADGHPEGAPDDDRPAHAW
jgi:hypothetical protein